MAQGKRQFLLNACLKLFHVEHGICSKTGNCWGKLGMFSSWISETLDLVLYVLHHIFFPSLKELVVSQIQVQLACLKKSILEQMPLSLSFENPWPGKNFRWGKQAHCSYGLIWWMEISLIITKGLCYTSQGAHLTLPKSSFWDPHPPLSFSSWESQVLHDLIWGCLEECAPSSLSLVSQEQGRQHFLCLFEEA